MDATRTQHRVADMHGIATQISDVKAQAATVRTQVRQSLARCPQASCSSLGGTDEALGRALVALDDAFHAYYEAMTYEEVQR